MSNVAQVQQFQPGPVMAMQPNPVADLSTAALVLDPVAMGHMMKLAEFMAGGRCTLPKEFVGSPGDCLAVVMQAMQWRMNPYAVAQKTFFISGKIGYEAQLINAAILTSGAIVGAPAYEWYGSWERIVGNFKELDSKKHPGEKYRVPGWNLADEDGLGIIIRATLRGESEPRELNLMLKQAGVRNSTLWADDPRQQLAYLAIKRWARLYCPHVILGAYSPDELEQPEPVVVGSGSTIPGTEPEPEKTTADKAREKMGKSRTKTAPIEAEPDVDTILQKIQAATGGKELSDAGALAMRLTSEQDKEKVRAAYTKRVNEIRMEREAAERKAAADAAPEQARAPQQSGPAQAGPDDEFSGVSDD